jgi:hypothetical protein
MAAKVSPEALGADSEEVTAAREVLEFCQNKLNAARIAYLHRTPLGGQEVTYDDLRLVAEELIQANYRVQKLRFGRVRVRLSASKLLRRGR